MKSALIVLNYNDYKTTELFLTQAKSFSVIDNIVVVDNHSTNSSYSELKKYESNKIRVIQTPKNDGYASGNDFGIKYAIKELCAKKIVISNPDVEVSNNTLEGMLSYLDNKSVGQVSGLMVNTSSIDLPSGWKLPSFKECVRENFFALNKFFGNKLYYSNSYWKSGGAIQVDVVPGSLFAIKSDVYVKIGGFDKRTFLYYEENILAYKLKKMGYNNYILSNYKFIHHHSVSIDKSISSTRKKLEIAEESRLLYCREYLHVGKFQELLVKMSFNIGTFNYLMYCKLLKK